MFTGIIEAVQPVKNIENTPTGKQITVELGELSSDAGLGDSIAVNGVCLTISRLTDNTNNNACNNQAVFDVMPETLRNSTLGSLHKNDMVNLERALSARGRFGGHFVQGHVDGTGVVKNIKNKAGEHKIEISVPNEIKQYIIPKGSIAVNGVSLTVVDITKESGFYVSLIPTTLKETNLDRLKINDRVNIETDILVKTIMQQLAMLTGSINESDTRSGLTLNKLLQQGY